MSTLRSGHRRRPLLTSSCGSALFPPPANRSEDRVPHGWRQGLTASRTHHVRCTWPAAPRNALRASLVTGREKAKALRGHEGETPRAPAKHPPPMVPRLRSSARLRASRQILFYPLPWGAVPEDQARPSHPADQNSGAPARTARASPPALHNHLLPRAALRLDTEDSMMLRRIQRAARLSRRNQTRPGLVHDQLCKRSELQGLTVAGRPSL